MSDPPCAENTDRAAYWLYATLAILVACFLFERGVYYLTIPAIGHNAIEYAFKLADVAAILQVVAVLVVGFQVNRKLAKIADEQAVDRSDSEFLKVHFNTMCQQIVEALGYLIAQSKVENPDFEDIRLTIETRLFRQVKFINDVMQEERLIEVKEVEIEVYDTSTDVKSDSDGEQDVAKEKAKSKEDDGERIRRELGVINSQVRNNLYEAAKNKNGEKIRTISRLCINSMDQVHYGINSISMSRYKNRRLSST